MRFLLVCKQKKNLDTFASTVRAVLDAGHDVVLTIQERDTARDERLVAAFGHHARLRIVPCPDARTDAWRASAPLVRSVRDWAQYLRPPYADATKLAARAATRLARELSVGPERVPTPAAASAAAARRVTDAFSQIEAAIPPDPLAVEFIARLAPDVVVVTPGLHFGSGQADLMKAARLLRIPLWMLLFSWDNLSTKGALHVQPDLLFVWNERQRREAAELHDVPADRVVVVGAPRFDTFFALRSQVARHEFFGPLGLAADRPTILYLCSSRFIAEDEPAFIASWLRALRASPGGVAACNVIVRPHPDVPFESPTEPRPVHWPSMPQATGWAHAPFDDSGALVLRTTYSTEQAFFECLHHANAVVALNTSAELEAGIAGRPVLTVLATDAAADGQSHTLHFSYLLRHNGGFVSYAASLDEHVSQLEAVLREPRREHEIQQFVRDFLRPLGDAPVAPMLAEALIRQAARAAPRAEVAEAAPARAAAAVETAPVEAAPVEPPAPPDEAVAPPRLLRLHPSGSGAIFATPETRRWRRDGRVVFAAAMQRWMDTALHPGDTVFDLGAGVGAHALYAALHRGCTVVALEPGFAAFKALCDNIVHNACGRRVWPFPVALSDRVGLVELEYPREPGSDSHTVSARTWRTARDGADSAYAQPVCAETLDAVVARHGLPMPEAVRLTVRRHAERVIAGAVATFSSPHLRTVACALRSEAEATAVADRLASLGFSTGPVVDEGDRGILVILERIAPAPRSGGIFRRLGEKLGAS